MEAFTAPEPTLILLCLTALMVAAMFIMGVIGTAMSAWKWCKSTFKKVKYGRAN